mmetsp:Transcript_50921/g.57678  ORF Transcript_50921/g.57678 Transcript_50921/m.57678 type:complete len:265 (-) Transcript_50921:206-1000(-)
MPSTIFSSSSDSSHIALLGYLQDYADISEKSHKEMKTSYWHLTKSRRNVSGILGVDSTTAFTAQLLREELRSRVRLIDDNNKATEEEEINLVDEDDSVLPPIKKDSSKSYCSSSSLNSPKWNLYDVLLKKEKEKNDAETLASVSSSHDAGNEPTLNTGLRQRKTRNISSTKIKSEKSKEKEQAQKKESNEATISSCTILHEEDLELKIDDDNEKLLGKDPIEFFYGHNRELKIAQRNAQNALNSYIQAANHAAVILTFLRESKK